MLDERARRDRNSRQRVQKLPGLLKTVGRAPERPV